MKLSEIELGDKISECVDRATGERTVYAVKPLIEFCRANYTAKTNMSEAAGDFGEGVTLVQVPIEQLRLEFEQLADGVRVTVYERGESTAYRDRLTTHLFELPRSLQLAQKPELLNIPIIFVRTPYEPLLLLDGTHRRVAAFLLGRKSLPAFIVPHHLAARFIIEDMPGDVLSNPYIPAFVTAHVNR